MEGVVCASCHAWLVATGACPGCGGEIVLAGEGKNVIDRLEPNCLIHRYDGSDMLEPAIVLKEGKTNIKAATKLREYSHPVTVPKQKVFRFDQNTLGAIQALRNERTATVMRYDQMIQSHWQRLKPYNQK
jgi:hypothetical protein